MADEPKAEGLLAVLRGAVDRHVKQRPRDTIVRNAVEDPAKPLARRVTERDACDFCNRFANGEPVDPAKVSERFHQFCKCHFMLFFQETGYREKFANDKELERIGVTMEEGADPDYHEKRDAMVLAALGRKVRFLKRHPSGARRADTLVDGELVEFKNPEGNGLFTVMYQIQSNLHGKNKSVIKAQSDVLLISNVRNSMTMLDMERSLAFAFGPDSKLTQAEKAYMRRIILLDERTRRVRTYEMKDAGVARLLGPRRRQENVSRSGAANQGVDQLRGGVGRETRSHYASGKESIEGRMGLWRLPPIKEYGDVSGKTRANMQSLDDLKYLDPVIDVAVEYGYIKYSKPLESFKSIDNERRDLFAHAALASKGYRVDVVEEVEGEKNIDILIDGVYWEIKSPDADGKTSKDPLKFVQNNIESAYDQFKEHPVADKSETRVVFNCRYTPVDEELIAKRIEREMVKRPDIKEVLMVTKDGDVVRFPR